MDIVVVGSVNMDTVLSVEHLPAEGETVTARRHFANPGGKGANQAVAAARLGREVAFVGCVGADPNGTALAEALRVEGVDTEHLSVVDSPSGMALITVGPSGANTIVVNLGANADLSVEQVTAAAEPIEAAAALMCQLEVPIASVAAALTSAKGLKVLNPAPATRLDADFVALADVVVPNETELGAMVNAPPPNGAEQAIGMARLVAAPVVVVTLGAGGAVFVAGGDSGHIPAPPVTPVDTTAAGDAFCAGLTDAMVSGRSLPKAVEWAVRVGATTVTRHGAQASLPRRDEVIG